MYPGIPTLDSAKTPGIQFGRIVIGRKATSIQTIRWLKPDRQETMLRKQHSQYGCNIFPC